MRISDWSSDVCSSDLAAEEDHIVRMGLLASGAAHELGTPLSTLSVILGDWHHEPAFQSNPQLLEEIEDMQAEVKRCKTIVTGILLSAGEARGESPHVTTVGDFLDELTEDWRKTRADRKSVVSGTSVSVRVDLGGGRNIKKKKKR